MSSDWEKFKSQLKFEWIPINKIQKSELLVRTRDVEKGLEKLETSLKEVGPIHPVRVYKEDDTYVLIAGQRRYEAFKRLGWAEIPATIMPKPQDPLDLLRISADENLIRLDLIRDDLSDLCEKYYLRYGKVSSVAQKLQLPESLVETILGIRYIEERSPEFAEHVRRMMLERPEMGKKIVEYGRQALKAASLGDKVDVKKAISFMEKLPEFSSQYRKMLVQKAQEFPEKTVEQLISEIKPTTVKYSIDMPIELDRRLTRASNKTGKPKDDLILEALESYLEELGV